MDVWREIDRVCRVRRRPPDRANAGEIAGDLSGYFVCEAIHLLQGKSSDFLWAEQVGKAREKVAKNEILKVRHGAKKCHLTTDKRTKSPDKVSVLFQTFTK